MCTWEHEYNCLIRAIDEDLGGNQTGVLHSRIQVLCYENTPCELLGSYFS